MEVEVQKNDNGECCNTVATYSNFLLVVRKKASPSTPSDIFRYFRQFKLSFTGHEAK